jgi:chromosome segregation protein
MLKRLELVGFKSFADKTLFDFPPGITAVVGPNGSGKSNIVDAVRWILGEQSAKSLRGGEMADVIFNGSTSRRSLGMAEVTMTFDNRARKLATAADEVQITRRVYRSGEGEYLINHQPSRLKDIKELFLGSGAGTEAYSIIEQGRVDVLLQASTRDRRVVFEEAAGISRFKAKKIEALRRLENVDQNLERIRDIIEEVERQLRSVKLQAAKAQRFQEYSNRLKELRVNLGLAEYHQLSRQLAVETSALDQQKAGLADRAARAESSEREISRLEAAESRLDQAIHQQETALAAAREHIASAEATLNRERTASADIEADLSETRARLAELNARVGMLAAAVRQSAAEYDAVLAQRASHDRAAAECDDRLQSAIHCIDELQRQIRSDKADHLEYMRQAARFHNDEVSSRAHLDHLRRERDRLLHKSEQAREHLLSLDSELQDLSHADDKMQASLTVARQKLVELRRERDHVRQQADDKANVLAELRAERTRFAGRIEVLEDLERRHEGLGIGVREMLALLEKNREDAVASLQPPALNASPWTVDFIPGLVADLLTVGHEYAALIDLALGERAQYFLVRDSASLYAAFQRGRPFSGQVSFLPLQASATATPIDSELGRSGVCSLPGLVVIADEVVTVHDPALAGLPCQLLGKTLIVRDLAAARGLAPQLSGYRFVTLQAEMLEADGTLTVGSAPGEAGILSRKSELRELKEQALAQDHQITAASSELEALGVRIDELDSRAHSGQQEIEVLTEQAADLRSRLGRRREQRQGLHDEVTLSHREMAAVEQDLQKLQAGWQQAKTQAEEAEGRVQTLQARLEKTEGEIRTAEQDCQHKRQAATAAKISLAQMEERLNSARARHQQLESDQVERQQEQLEGKRHVADARRRLQESQRAMLEATSALARWYLDKEVAECQVSGFQSERELLRQERQILSDQAQAVRQEWRLLQEQAHARELEASEIRHRRDSLVGRLREDYQFDLAEMYREKSKAQSPRSHVDEDSSGGGDLSTLDFGLEEAVVNEEIGELRRKLSRLGSVNLDSLQELAELETRATTLQSQFDDLTSAKRSLEEIIAAINEDSRRLFTETFATVRIHFQELFRKLFGGGMADVVLEDENDILESGVEIIARPPGKELRSISLMSGGEKTLTAVALLLAVFRSKPSPFCILDEVDAALDEANIARFTAVLHEFLDQSQFIIITHSKRTMAVADVLYGVTMQESGVSKRVAVRFEDWVEDGDTLSSTRAPTQTNGPARNGLSASGPTEGISTTPQAG